MAYRKKLRTLFGFLKDKSSLIRTTLSTKRHLSSIRRVILRATPHGAPSQIPDYRIAAVLALGHGSRTTASLCIQALMDRLHGTRNATVAFKCLYIVHNIISNGSFILKDQISVYPSSGGRNFLNLSRFRDNSDSESWEFSLWVRWYAGVLERNLMVSRVLGHHLGSPRPEKDKTDDVLVLSISDLLNDVDMLVSFIEEIHNVPDSLHLRRNNLVFEAVRLIGEDFRFVQREILVRVIELGERSVNLSGIELTQFLSCLERLDLCKEKVAFFFGTIKLNAHLWELTKETKINLVEMAEEKGRVKVPAIGMGNELTRSERWFHVALGTGSGSELSGRDWIPLTVATVG